MDGGKPKTGSSIHLNRKAAIVCSLKCTNSHGLLVRPDCSFDTSLTWSLTAV